MGNTISPEYNNELSQKQRKQFEDYYQVNYQVVNIQNKKELFTLDNRETVNINNNSNNQELSLRQQEQLSSYKIILSNK